MINTGECCGELIIDIKTRIKELRTNAGYTQNFVADYLHIAQKTYSDYELGKSFMSTDYLINDIYMKSVFRHAQSVQWFRS